MEKIVKPWKRVAVLVTLLVLPTLALAQPGTATSSAPQEYKCGVFAPDRNGELEVQPLTALHIAGDTFSLPSNTPSGVESVYCTRSGIYLFKNDYKVLSAGYVLLIYTADAERIGALESEKGKLQLRMISGEMTPSEIEAAQKALDPMQLLFNDYKPAK